MIGLVRFAGRRNLVSARVPSHTVFTVPNYDSNDDRTECDGEYVEPREGDSDGAEDVGGGCLSLN